MTGGMLCMTFSGRFQKHHSNLCLLFIPWKYKSFKMSLEPLARDFEPFWELLKNKKHYFSRYSLAHCDNFVQDCISLILWLICILSFPFASGFKFFIRIKFFLVCLERRFCRLWLRKQYCLIIFILLVHVNFVCW